MAEIFRISCMEIFHEDAQVTCLLRCNAGVLAKNLRKQISNGNLRLRVEPF